MNLFQSFHQIDNVDGKYYANRSKELFFRDGKRRIDYVVVYKNPKNAVNSLAEKRMQFFSLLASKSINIEVESSIGVIHAFSRSGDEDDNDDLYKPIFESNVDRLTVARLMSQEEGIGFDPIASNEQIEDQEANNLLNVEADEISNEVLYFAKLYVPWEVMKKYAEVLKLRKPIKKIETYSKLPDYEHDPFKVFALSEEDVKPITFPFTIPFQASKEFLFNIDSNDRDSFFTESERSLVIDFILRKLSSVINSPDERPTTKVEENGQNDETDARQASEQNFIFEDMSIEKMINDDVFLAAYPLHEASKILVFEKAEKHSLYEEDEPGKKRKVDNSMNVKIMLKKYWASYTKVFRDQPLDYVRLYFGESISFYFAWMSFYTKALVPVAIIGLIVFISNYFTTLTDGYLKDVCEDNGDILMCPLCKDGCQFWLMKDACEKTRFSRMLDNGGTVFFALVVALWSTLFLELWKRYQYRLAYRWNVHELEAVQEAPRPEFIALIDTGKFEVIKNPITNMKEPKVTLKHRIPITLLGYVTTTLAILVCVSCLLAVNVYKSTVLKALIRSKYRFLNERANLITATTGALLNLIVILILNYLYGRVSQWLTDKEAHRTQTQYNDALVFKMFALKFVNFFLFFFYLAFIRGPTAALPGDEPYILQSTPCDMNDCLYDLFIQLLIVFTGKQAFNFINESLLPIILKSFRKFKLKAFKDTHECDHDEEGSTVGFRADIDPHLVNLSEQKHRWQATLKTCRNDLALGDPGKNPMFDEYLEMKLTVLYLSKHSHNLPFIIVLQFGFITLFVAAFPLAPLFALINNVFELRQDAKKFLNSLRRSVPTRTKNIGIWYTILDVISKFSIRTNAFIIAITSQFIQRLVYENVYRPMDKYGLDGYLEFSLSFMDVSRFQSSSAINATKCRYLDYRTAPDDPNGPYRLTLTWWHIFAAKFIFVLVFENMVLLITAIISEMIPDKPNDLRVKMMLEDQMLSNIILHVNEHRFEKLHHHHDEGHDEPDGRGANKRLFKRRIAEIVDHEGQIIQPEASISQTNTVIDQIIQEPGFYIYENGEAKKHEAKINPVMFAEDVLTADTMNNVLMSGVPLLSTAPMSFDDENE